MHHSTALQLLLMPAKKGDARIFLLNQVPRRTFTNLKHRWDNTSHECGVGTLSRKTKLVYFVLGVNNYKKVVISYKTVHKRICVVRTNI